MRLQVVTGGGKFSDCMPPAGISRNSKPEDLLQRRAVQSRLADLIEEADACLLMHGSQSFRDITRRGVRSFILKKVT